jgi:hypothetical protein
MALVHGTAAHRVHPINLTFGERPTVFGDVKIPTALLDLRTRRSYILETGFVCFP